MLFSKGLKLETDVYIHGQKMKLNGKIAIVTGAGRGIGASIALTLAREGANVVIIDVDKQSAENVANKIKILGRQALALKADVSKSVEVNKVIKAAWKQFGKIDILVNNAGIFKEAQITRMREEEWDETMNINLKGVFNCCRAVIPYMIKQGNGKIVNISSIDARQGCVGYAHYAASKAGVIGFTRSLAKELAPYGINVNAVAPGIIETDMTKERIAKFRRDYERLIPLGRIGKPEDVAGVVLFLVSNEADYITGQTINVDGGWRMD